MILYVYTCVSIYIYTYMCVYIYICIFQFLIFLVNSQLPK